jgi:hypothetical protein
MKVTHQIVIEKGSDLIPWLSLGASVVLALITLWYVILTSRMLRQAQLVEGVRERQQVESQASQIAAWVSSSAVEERQVTLETTLFNPTSQAVYDVQVAVMDMSGGPLSSAPHSVPVLGPGDRRIHHLRCRLPSNAGGSLRTTLVFTDGKGLRWRRREDGVLMRDTAGSDA